MKRFLFVAVALANLALALVGCSTMRSLGAVSLTKASLADLELEGTVGGSVAFGPALAALAEVAPELAPQLQAFSSIEIGSILLLQRLGEPKPVYILLVGEWQQRSFPLHARIRVWGKPLGSTGLILPARITCGDCED